jgi:hypothetical protein
MRELDVRGRTGVGGTSRAGAAGSVVVGGSGAAGPSGAGTDGDGAGAAGVAGSDGSIEDVVLRFGGGRKADEGYTGPREILRAAIRQGSARIRNFTEST